MAAVGGPERAGELAQLEDVIHLQERALAQHRAAETHWSRRGDEVREQDAIWRQAYVADLLAQLRAELAAAR